MLNEREQDALREIERRLAADDPDLERSFAALDDVPRPSGRPRVSSVVIAVAAGLALVMLPAGSPVGAVAYAVFGALVWVVRDLPDHPTRDERGR
ncbi:DUF3040 domain-containing protein [Actinosynnema sp. NPDC053489]|uniref:DUF3040 domain-containing protein n=1 Tax=Actinosynnema sp. NPDC053489 TaxID=3363916 RepID=UPI0037C923E3